MPPFNFDFFNVQGGTGQAPPLQWQASPGMADVSQIDEWINPLLTAKAKRDINVFQYGREIGAERGAEQNRLAQEIEIKRKLEGLMKESGLGAEEGQDLDVTDPFSPEAQASRLRYQMGRQGAQDQYFDAGKDASIANTQSIIRKREQDEQFRRFKLEEDQRIDREKLDVQRDVAEGRLSMQQAALKLRQLNQASMERLRNAEMANMEDQSDVRWAAQKTREWNAEANYERLRNPMLSPGVQAREEKARPIIDALSTIKQTYQPDFVGVVDQPIGDIQRTLGLASPKYNQFREAHEIVRQYLANELYAGSLTINEAERFEQMLSGRMGEGAYKAAIDELTKRQETMSGLRRDPRQLGVGAPPRSGRGGSGSASDVDSGAIVTVSSPDELYKIQPGTRVRTPKGTGVVMPGGKVKYDAS